MNAPAYPKYTATRDMWVGAAPSHWKFLRADFTTASNKEQISSAAMEGTEVLHYSIPNVQEFGTAQIEEGNEIDSAKLRITTAQLLISKLNPRKATLCIAEPDAKLLTVCSGEFVPIIPEGELTLKYSYYTWISDKVTKLLSSRVQSVTRSHQRVSPADITKLPWAWPPKKEQQQIAAFLDWKTGQIDALIGKKQELLEKLKEKRIALITQAVTQGLNPSVPMRDSGIPWLGQVPQHWEVKRLRFASHRIEQGWSPQCDNQPADEDSWGVMKVGCVNGDLFNPEENKTLPPDLKPAEKYELKAGDILISRANTSELLGSAAIVPEGTRAKLLLCDKLFRVTPEAELRNDFLTFFLRTPIARFQYEREATGASSSMKNIGQGTIKDVPTVIPPTPEQEAICDYIRERTGALDSLIVTVESAIDRLSEYRTALITAATSGKIDVRNMKIPKTVPL